MNGTITKDKTALRGLAGQLRRVAVSRAGRAGLRAGTWAAGAFLLAAPGLLGGPLPLAAVLALCGPQPGAALLGACGGYALFWGWELAMEPLALSLSCFAGVLIFRRTPVSRPLLAVGLSLAVGGLFLLDTGLGLVPLVRLAVSAASAGLWARLWAPEGLSLPAKRREFAARPPELPAQRRVEKALLTMHGVLAREDPVLPPLGMAGVYDFAAEQVCRCCVRRSQCWELCAEDTYRDLVAAGEAILARGAALREDFPPRFTDRCRHTAGFLTAVNQALDEALEGRREELRRQESRRVAAGQYLALQRLLAALTRTQPRTLPAFAPELAVGSACKVGNSLSGDRGAACRDRLGAYYVALCDGMGTGAAARTESDRSVRLLTAFLETGMEPDTVLELLNGFYVLRRETAFATLDLLRLDLHTGEATLYKWGAAPSYLWREGAVQEIGTATPPPGLEAAGGRVPGQHELSLREGETLVMVSDGAYGEETARRLAAFVQGSVRDLAACLITLGDRDPADDRTVVVVRLRSLNG